jgi:transcription-repair coupling factor (superfamily II helicase)
MRAIEEVKRSMEDAQPMDRLLCGDVGFGKTEVALRAAFKAVMDGKQAAILAPTTILAFQHFENFKERLKEFPVNIEMLNRFRTVKQQRVILEGLAKGEIDLVIGTHRLLSDDVRFKDLGLLIIDEEQRFGVKHKEKLKKYRATVDILSMTATPIPRTLHMALMGARDLSNIETAPRNRLPVHTEIIHWNDDVIYRIINRELERKGQIYFVHNRVETIESMKTRLEELVPHARIAIGHGQMNEKKLEKVMLDFMHYKYDILLSSMIIENGLDISNVNTIIINRAERFGLSQLYQLRGRVGRSTEQAYAYLLVPPMNRLSETARKRLHTIQDFTDLGSGFKVALRDLEIRGAGNLLGKEQSGFVQTVGFDMYCKILDEAVEELSKGGEVEIAEGLMEKKRNYIEPKLDVNFDLLIPNKYIANNAERIAIYHRAVNLNDTEQIAELEKELQDRFGTMPENAQLFLEAMTVKILAGHLYAKRVIINNRVLKLFFSEEAQNDDAFFQDIIPRLMEQKLTAVHFLNQKDLGVEITLKGEDNLSKLAFSKKILHYVMNNG